MNVFLTVVPANSYSMRFICTFRKKYTWANKCSVYLHEGCVFYCCRKEPLPGPESGLLSNTWK